MKAALQARAALHARRAVPGFLPIAAVEREVGLSKDTLRVWERRYGFPQPQRDAVGTRSYPLAQVQRLRALKRLLDAGYRAGRVVPLAAGQLAQLASRLDAEPVFAAGAAQRTEERAWRALFESVRRHDVHALRAGLLRANSRLGLRGFVTQMLVPLTVEVGQTWLDGSLPVFAEHLFTHTVQSVLQHALLQLPAPADARPRVLLATTTGEPHGLGLLMAQAMMALEGCDTVSLGVQTPPGEVAAASKALHMDVVALSFSGGLPRRATAASAAQMLAALPPATALWLGGRGASALVSTQDGAGRMQVFSQLDEIAAAAAHWRARHLS